IAARNSSSEPKSFTATWAMPSVAGASAALIVKGLISGQGLVASHKGRVEPPGQKLL
ncbi:MAG: hypothetical protein JWN96_3381, partial [Mycobacterium sp.]|nr:hypothetical protein [Mycobacterium sp.]